MNTGIGKCGQLKVKGRELFVDLMNFVNALLVSYKSPQCGGTLKSCHIPCCRAFARSAGKGYGSLGTG